MPAPDPTGQEARDRLIAEIGAEFRRDVIPAFVRFTARWGPCLEAAEGWPEADQDHLGAMVDELQAAAKAAYGREAGVES